MKYRAFFSYSRANDRTATWLHRRLDSYRTPKPLVGTNSVLGPVPAKLHPIFRDRTDMSGGGQLPERIEGILKDSETLIVLCSPESAASVWVNREVETFIALGRGERIFPVVAPGLRDVADVEASYFPLALRGKGMLAADLRDIKLPNGQVIGDGREGGRLKLIAGLLGVSLDALARRERVRQRRLVGALAATAVLFAAVALLAGVQTLTANANLALAQQNEREAKRQQGIAEANAAEEREARSLAELRTAERDAKTLEAVANLEEAKRQGGIASANARDALSTLHRVFASQGWIKHDVGDYSAAARYALAGMRLAPENAHLYRALLAASMHDAVEGAPPMAHDGPIYNAAFSQDGSRAVTAGTDNTARIWDAATGRLIGSLRGHAGTVDVAVFSPDGARVVTTSGDKTARIWDARDATAEKDRLVATLSGHEGAVRTAAYSPDGERVVTTGRDKVARIWNARDGRLIITLSGHSHMIWQAMFTPGGARVVTASLDQTAKIWNAEDGRLIATLQGHAAPILDVDVSSDGARIATCGEDGLAKVWDAESGQLISTLDAHKRVVRDVRFSPDGDRIVTAGDDNTARIWDVRDGRLVATLSGHRSFVNTAEFSPDGSRVVTSSQDYTAKVWDARDGRLLLTNNAHRHIVWSAEFSPDGARILTASSDGTARTWDARKERVLFTLEGHAGSVRDASFSTDATRIITGSDDRTARVWDAEAGRPIVTLTAQSRVKSARFSPDGARIVTASRVAEIWDARSGRRAATLGGTTPVRTQYATFSRDGSRIVTADADQEIRVWDSQSGQLLQGMQGFSAPVETAALSADGQRLLATNWSRALVIRVKDARTIVTIDNGFSVTSSAFSPDEQRIVTTGGKAGSAVWDARTGRLIATLNGHEESVVAASFSPDGTRIITASQDKTSRVWDAEDGRLIGVLAGHDGAVYSAAFSPKPDPRGGFRVVTAGSDRMATVWNVPRLTQGWSALALDACANLLGPRGRVFTQVEIDADPLLRAAWPNADRDVCEGVAGVPRAATQRIRHDVLTELGAIH